jgi:shikimate dehydrogenase
VVEAAETVFDVVALPALTPLGAPRTRPGRQVITGAEVIALQALEPFVLYTGVRPTDDQVRRAAEFSRA